jgi:hypothetical protein
MQSRLACAWPLHKDDTQNREAFHTKNQLISFDSDMQKASSQQFFKLFKTNLFSDIVLYSNDTNSGAKRK